MHGDYDVDGVCSTAILVRALRDARRRRRLVPPEPDRRRLRPVAATVERLAARGTRLLITVDCAITAVERGRRRPRRRAGRRRHRPPRPARRRRRCPTRRSSTRASAATRAPTCARPGVAAQARAALGAAAGRARPRRRRPRPRRAGHGRRRRPAQRREPPARPRRACARCAATRTPGLRALMEVAAASTRATLDARALGFRLGPRINAAGRLHRADAGVELLLTERRRARARAIARELDAANAERRAVEQRIRWEAEAPGRRARRAPRLRPRRPRAGIPGVIGIVASRIAERHHRPAVLIALDGARAARAPGRSIPGFDLLGGLDACAERAPRATAATAPRPGSRIARGEPSRPSAPPSRPHAAAALTPDDLVAPRARRRRRRPATTLGLDAGRGARARLEPFGAGNPAGDAARRPARRCADPRTMGRGPAPRASRSRPGGARARAVAFGAASDAARRGRATPVRRSPSGSRRREWNGAVEPRLILRGAARRGVPGPIEVVGEPAPEDRGCARRSGSTGAPRRPRPSDAAGGRRRPPALAAASAPVVDRRGRPDPVAVLADLVAHRRAGARRRGRRRAAAARGLAERTGGFALCSWAALEADPELAARYRHVVALDPPGRPLHRRCPGRAVDPPRLGRRTSYASPRADARARARPAAGRSPRSTARSRGRRRRSAATASRRCLRGDAERPRSAAHAGRLVGVLSELELVRARGASRRR